MTARYGRKKEAAKVVPAKAASKPSLGYGPVKAMKSSAERKITRVVIKYDVGYNNQLYIRGNAPGLSWDKGVIMKNVGPDQWIWETSIPFAECEFKVLINDQYFECGDNHRIAKGGSIEYSPRFS